AGDGVQGGRGVRGEGGNSHRTKGSTRSGTNRRRHAGLTRTPGRASRSRSACANSSILLLGRGRWRGRGRRALGVRALDLRTLAELGNGLGLGPAHHVGLDLVLDLLERRNRAVALVLDLDHVPAELRLDRIRQLALV